MTEAATVSAGMGAGVGNGVGLRMPQGDVRQTADTARYAASRQGRLDPSRRQFVYSGGMPHLVADGLGTSSNPIQGGSAVSVYPIGGTIPVRDSMTGDIKEARWEENPRDLVTGITRKFQTTEDFGVRALSMLTDLPYSVDAASGSLVDLAYGYFDVVHQMPKTPCSYGLNRPVQLTDPEVGASELSFQHCPTCQLAELLSDACSQRIADAVEGMGFDVEILSDLREVLIEANRAAIARAERSTAMVAADIKNRATGSQNGRTKFNTIDAVMFKMQHRDMPEAEAGLNMERLASVVASAVAVANKTADKEQGVRGEGQGGIDFRETAEYKEFIAMKDSFSEFVKKQKEHYEAKMEAVADRRVEIEAVEPVENLVENSVESVENASQPVENGLRSESYERETNDQKRNKNKR